MLGISFSCDVYCSHCFLYIQNKNHSSRVHHSSLPSFQTRRTLHCSYLQLDIHNSFETLYNFFSEIAMNLVYICQISQRVIVIFTTCSVSLTSICFSLHAVDLILRSQTPGCTSVSFSFHARVGILSRGNHVPSFPQNR